MTSIPLETDKIQYLWYHYLKHQFILFTPPLNYFGHGGGLRRRTLTPYGDPRESGCIPLVVGYQWLTDNNTKNTTRGASNLCRQCLTPILRLREIAGVDTSTYPVMGECDDKPHACPTSSKLIPQDDNSVTYVCYVRSDFYWYWRLWVYRTVPLGDGSVPGHVRH